MSQDMKFGFGFGMGMCGLLHAVYDHSLPWTIIWFAYFVLAYLSYRQIGNSHLRDSHS